MTDVSLFQVGNVVEFQYPAHNFYGVVSNLETRRLQVTEVRDMAKNPLEAETCLQQPLLNRGRYLVTGCDLDKSAERSFYLNSISGATVVSRQ